METTFDLLNKIQLLKMKKLAQFKSITYLFLTIISITSCDVLDKNETDLEKENLKGEVILITTNTIYTEKVAIPGGIFLQTYNNKGMKTKEFSGVLGKLFILYETIYENERKILVRNSLDFGSGISKTEDKYLYDINGKLDSINYNDDGHAKYTYGEDGKLIRDAYISNTIRTITDYFYSKSKLDSKTITYQEGDNVSYRTIKYGKDLQINKSFNVETNGNKVLRDITYFKKNESGDHIEELFDEYDSDGIKIKSNTIKYEYNYDEIGNWIQQRQIEEGVLKSTTNRTIVYKGGETSIYTNEIDKIISSLSGSGNNINNSAQNDNNSSSSKKNNYSQQIQQPEKQQQWVNCPSCRGTGEIVCRECNGTTLMFCGSCDGRGTFQGKTCYLCKGALKVKCTPCYGKGTKGRCNRCHGKGQIPE